MKKYIFRTILAGAGGALTVYLTKDLILTSAIGVVIILILNLVEKKITKE